jgi:hypothetical protein
MDTNYGPASKLAALHQGGSSRAASPTFGVTRMPSIKSPQIPNGRFRPPARPMGRPHLLAYLTPVHNSGFFNRKEKVSVADNAKEPRKEVIMNKLIAIFILIGSSMIFLAQTTAEPQGEASVVFESAGGKWQRARITDQLTGETSTAYLLDAETPSTLIETKRHPRMVFTCQNSGQFDGLRIRTGTIVASHSDGTSDHFGGRTRVSSRIDDQKIQTWTADVAKTGSDLFTKEGTVIDLAAHKRFVIRFASASGKIITDEYLTDGLSIELLKADCPAFFRKR